MDIINSTEFKCYLLCNFSSETKKVALCIYNRHKERMGHMYETEKGTSYCISLLFDVPCCSFIFCNI